jgi:hypothetical protein
VAQPQSQTREHPRCSAMTPGYPYSLETLLRRISPRGWSFMAACCRQDRRLVLRANAYNEAGAIEIER